MIAKVDDSSKATHLLTRLNPTNRSNRKWEPFAFLEIRESNGVEVAEFVVNSGLATVRQIKRNKVKLVAIGIQKQKVTCSACHKPLDDCLCY